MTAAALAVAGCGSVSAPGSAPAAAPRAAGTATALHGSSAAQHGSSAAQHGSSAEVLHAGSRLCARPDAVSRVVIARRIWPRGFRPAGPAVPGHPVIRPHAPRLLPRPIPARTITSASRVHALARALCALPAMPPRRFMCPILFPGGFQLLFRADGSSLPVVMVQDSGCGIVTGLGPPRWSARSPSFWKLLDSLAGSLPPMHFPGGRILVPPPWRPVGPGKASCESGALPCPTPPRATSVPHA
jgi:hypothetical protein